MDVLLLKKCCFKELTSELNVSIVLKRYTLTQDQWDVGCGKSSIFPVFSVLSYETGKIILKNIYVYVFSSRTPGSQPDCVEKEM